MLRRHRRPTSAIPVHLFLGALLIATTVLISPPNASAAGSFDDDDGNVHEGAIEAIALAGITAGCGPERFCPDSPVTRGEMAAFLSRAFDLLPGARNDFRDDDDSIFEEDINSIERYEITLGCNPPANDRFCPDDPVTREQMASFLTRAMDREQASMGSNPFHDISSSVHADDIRRIADIGVTKGCNPPANDQFCPRQLITRGQMASFLARALDLDIPQPTDDPGDDPSDGESPLPTIEIPANAVELNAGASLQSAANSHGSGTAFVLSPGNYNGQTVTPKTGQQFYGLPGAVMRGNGADRAFDARNDDVIVSGIEITGYDPDGRWDAVIHDSGADDWIVEGNHIHHNGMVGIKAGDGWLILNNKITHHYQYGMQVVDSSGTRVIDNEIAHNSNNSAAGQYNDDQGATKFARNVNLILRGNYVHDNYGDGLWVDINNANTLIEDNRVDNNHGSGIFVEISCGAVIRDNTLSGNGHGQYPNWAGDAPAIQVANSPDVEVYRNTVTNNDKGIGGIHWGHPNTGAVSRCDASLRNFSVHDNTVTQSSGMTVGLDAQVDGNAAYTSWNNRFYDNDYNVSGSAFFRWNGNNLSLSQWLNNVED